MTDQAKHSSFRPDVQAIRALAVLIVVIYHLWPERLPGGFIGVDVFFVISGYLITAHLVREISETATVDVPAFWARRIRRLLPAAFTVLLFCALATLAWMPRSTWSGTFEEIAASSLYSVNWLFAASAVDYLGATEEASIVQHFWSLAVEEQFYLVWPVLIAGSLLAARFVRRRPVLLRSDRRRVVALLLAVIVAVSLVVSIVETIRSQPSAYFITVTRAWEFAAGGLLVFIAQPAFGRRDLIARRISWLAGVALIMLAALTLSGSSPFPGALAILPVAGAALLIWAGGGAGRRTFAALEWRPIQFLGDISYSVYLWHWPLIVLYRELRGNPPGLLGGALIVATTVALAYLTKRWIEDPFRSREFWTVSKARPFLFAAMGTASILALAGGGILTLQHESRSAAAAAAEATREGGECFGAAALGNPECPSDLPLALPPSFVGDDDGNRDECWSPTGGSEFRSCSLGPATGYERHVVAVGDSHNNSLIPAYERAAVTLNWRIDVIGKGGCYWSAATPDRPTDSWERDCEKWKEKVADHLRDAGPLDAVLVTHSEGYPLIEPSGAGQKETEIRGLVEAWTHSALGGTKVVALSDVPAFPSSVLACVEEHGQRSEAACSVDRKSAFPDEESNSAAGSVVRNSVVIDTADYYCGVERCSPVVGGVPVFATHGHLTATYAASVGPLLAADLAEALQN